MALFEPASQNPGFDLLYQQYLARQKNTEDFLRLVGDNSSLEGEFGSLEDVVAALVAQIPVTFGPVALSGTSTSIITTIPSWATRIVLSVYALSTNGTSTPIIQLGTSGGLIDSGYLGSASRTEAAGNDGENHTNGFRLMPTNIAAGVMYGEIRLRLHNSSDHTWIMSSELGRSDTARSAFAGGAVTLSAALTQLAATTVGGVNTFDGSSAISGTYYAY